VSRVGCVSRQREAKALNTSTSQIATSGAKCSVARLTVVWSVAHARALVNPNTMNRNSSPAAIVTV